MSSMPTKEILTYMADDNNRYAIALEGEWGSGKTRFCEQELAAYLRDVGYSMIRISLFGVSTVDELYGRLAMATVQLDVDEDDGRAARLAKGAATTVAKAGLSLGKNLLDKYGIRLDATPQMLTALLDRRCLVVFDDYERQRFGKNAETDLFGAINDLVEGQGCKVMLVTNDYQAIDANLREKTVWKCYRFDPAPDELARAIILPEIVDCSENLDFDAGECVEKAACQADCHNARAMLKSTELISWALHSSVAEDAGIDVENRERALRDFVAFALLASMGRAPKRPPEREPNEELDLERIHSLVEFDRYAQLGVIESYYDPKKSVAMTDVDTCLRSYVTAQYAGSPETMEVNRLLERAHNIAIMGDEEAEEVTHGLSACLRHGQFDLSCLNRVIRMNSTFRKWGFDGALCSEEALTCAKRMVDKNLELANKKVHKEYDAWKNDWSQCEDDEELDRYIVEECRRIREERCKQSIDACSPETGIAVSSMISDGLRKGELTHLDYAPSLIADIFANGSPASQNALYELVCSLKHWAVFYTNSESSMWARNLYVAFSEMKVETNTGKVRLRWMLGALDEALKLFEKGTT